VLAERIALPFGNVRLAIEELSRFVLIKELSHFGFSSTGKLYSGQTKNKQRAPD